MSEESTTSDPVERTRQVFDTASRQDHDAVLSFFAPDAVMDLSDGGILGQQQPVPVPTLVLAVILKQDLADFLIVRILAQFGRGERDAARALMAGVTPPNST